MPGPDKDIDRQKARKTEGEKDRDIQRKTERGSETKRDRDIHCRQTACVSNLCRQQ